MRPPFTARHARQPTSSSAWTASARFLHERAAALRPARRREPASDGRSRLCLVTGIDGAARRLHPKIKGVEGAAVVRRPLVSFNLDAFTSYGKEQGDNAPTSEAAAFRYGAALNRMLDRGSRNRAAAADRRRDVVFWADTSGTADEAAAAAAEDVFALSLRPSRRDDATRERPSCATRWSASPRGRPVDGA